MSDPDTPPAADAIELLLRHHWPRAAQEVAAVAGLQGRLDPTARQQLDPRIAACAETAVTGQHEVLGIAHGSIVSTLQLTPLAAEEEMRAAFSQAVRWIEIETSSQCNRRCTYCPNAEFDRISSNDFLDATLYTRILHDLSSIDYDGELVLVGTNEIFMHPRNLDYIAAARQELPACRIKLFSNGDYLNRAHLDQLVTLGVDSLVVTFHPAAGKPYDEREVRARAGRFAERLGITLRLSSAQPKRHLYFSAQLGRLHLTAGLQNFAISGHSWAGAVGETGEIRRSAPCTYPIRQFVLNHDADIFMCCFPVKERTQLNLRTGAIAGNMKDFPSIFHAYASTRLLGWRRALLTNGEKPEPCLRCAGHAGIDESQFRDLARRASRLLQWEQQAAP
ncbi:MAG TPA: radical SAM protein [Acetobacteraceae bacterium]